MGADARYSVELDIKKVGSGWDDMSSGVGRFSSALDSVAGKIAGLGKYAVMGTLAAGIGAATYGITNLNAQAERAAIGIGTIFSVNGMAANVPAGITKAGAVIQQMRLDAQKLPGEFEDLQTIFTMGATSAFRSGASIDQWRDLSSKAMAAGAVTMMPMDQVAREMTQLLEGHAGGHNVFGGKLGFTGDKARELNKMSSQDRFAALSGEMNKFSGSLDIFAKSWEGITSTLADNVKGFARVATEPLFDTMKDTLGDVNKWFTDNQSTVTFWANHIGLKLKHAFETGREVVEEWGPPLIHFADTAANRLSALWERAEPAAQAFASAMKSALDDPNGTIDKLVKLGEIYVGMKLGGSLVGSMGSLGTGAGRAGAGFGLATAGVGGVLMGADGAGATTAEVGGTVGGGALAGSALGPFGAMIGAALGSLGFATAEYVRFNEVKKSGEEQATDANYKLGESLWQANDAVNSFAAKHGDAQVSFGDAVDQWAQKLAENGDETGASLFRLQSAANEASFQLQAMFAAYGDAKTKDMGKDATDTMNLGFLGAAQNWLTAQNSDTRKAPKMKGGHGGTSIQKVEIVVTSNQSPSRIARAVDAKLAQRAHSRRASPFVKNFSALDEDG